MDQCILAMLHVSGLRCPPLLLLVFHALSALQVLFLHLGLHDQSYMRINASTFMHTTTLCVCCVTAFLTVSPLQVIDKTLFASVSYSFWDTAIH